MLLVNGFTASAMTEHEACEWTLADWKSMESGIQESRADDTVLWGRQDNAAPQSTFDPRKSPSTIPSPEGPRPPTISNVRPPHDHTVDSFGVGHWGISVDLALAH